MCVCVSCAVCVCVSLCVGLTTRTPISFGLQEKSLLDSRLSLCVFCGWVCSVVVVFCVFVCKGAVCLCKLCVFCVFVCVCVCVFVCKECGASVSKRDPKEKSIFESLLQHKSHMNQERERAPRRR